jgi:hypothetical protein
MESTKRCENCNKLVPRTNCSKHIKSKSHIDFQVEVANQKLRPFLQK